MKDKTANRSLGSTGEGVAVGHLEGLGFKIVDRNVRYKTGEIDIVAWRGKGLHFIEVKTRRDHSSVPPLESITPMKMRRIRRTAEAYLMDGNKDFRDDDLPSCHFDVIAVDYADGVPKIECVFDAFE